MLAFIAIRIVIDALLARFALGLRGPALLRVLGAIVSGDVLVVMLALAGAYGIGRSNHVTGMGQAGVGLAAVTIVVVGALLIWEGGIRWASRPSPISRQRLGAAATLLLLAGLVQVGAFAAAQLQPPDGLAQVTRWEVRLANLPPAFDGLRVCCVGDLHVHQPADAAGARTRLRPLARLDPDLILFVGDYATGRPRYEGVAARILAEQHARLGVYAVLGNHDRWLGEAHSLGALRGAGVHVLVNETVALKRGRDRLFVAGVNDPYTSADDLAAALSAVPPGACIVLMAHSPDIITEARARGVALVLAGHTHGGQVSLPLVGPPVVRSRYGNKYAHGLFHEGKTTMFVTRGVGEIFPNIRFNCPREIALLTLRRGQEERN